MEASHRLHPLEVDAYHALPMFAPKEGPRSGPDYDRYRAEGNRSFPTGYPVPDDATADDFEAIKLWQARVTAELGMGGGLFKAGRRAKLATSADRRAMIGPSREDIDALGDKVLAGWCLAQMDCMKLGILKDDPLALNPHVRYGLVLDFLTRNYAAQLHQISFASSPAEANSIFGLDVIRIAVEHGTTPDTLGRVLAGLAA